MKNSAKAYIAAVSLVGIVLVAYFVSTQSLDHPVRFLFLAVLAWIGSALKIRLPGMHGTLSLSFLPILYATTVLNLGEIVLIGASSGVVQTLWRPRTRPRLARVAFNSAAPVIGIAVAGLLLLAILDGVGREFLPLALIVASSAYYLVSTVLVSAVVCLVESREFSAIWRGCCLPTLPYVAGGSVLALFCGNLALAMDWRAGIFAMALMLPLHLFYRTRMAIIS